MIATIAVTAAIAETKKFIDRSDHMETTFQRSQRQRSLRKFWWIFLMLRLIGMSFFSSGFNYHEVCFTHVDWYIDSLLISHHLFTLGSSEFSTCSRVLRSFADANTLVSSAKILKLNFSELFGKPLIRNKRGPMVLSYGIAHNVVWFLGLNPIQPPHTVFYSKDSFETNSNVFPVTP